MMCEKGEFMRCVGVDYTHDRKEDGCREETVRSQVG